MNEWWIRSVTCLLGRCSCCPVLVTTVKTFVENKMFEKCVTVSHQKTWNCRITINKIEKIRGKLWADWQWKNLRVRQDSRFWIIFPSYPKNINLTSKVSASRTNRVAVPRKLITKKNRVLVVILIFLVVVLSCYTFLRQVKKYDRVVGKEKKTLSFIRFTAIHCHNLIY